jgi:hypothetical protein
VIHELISLAVDSSAVMAHAIHHVVAAVQQVLPAWDPPTPIDPGNKLPGREKVGEVIWVARFITGGLALIGACMVAGGMMLSHSRGEGIRHLGAVGLWGCGVFFLGVASSVVSWLAN